MKKFNYEEYKRNIAINNLKKQLAATDYKTLKYLEGYITEEEYQPIKEQRQALRNEINKLLNNK